MHGVGVGSGMDRDGRNAEILAGTQHAQCDLAAIGDQDFFKHAAGPDRLARPRGWRCALGGQRRPRTHRWRLSAGSAMPTRLGDCAVCFCEILR